VSFPDPLGLFSSSASSSSAGRSGFAPGQLFQALRANFGQQMQAMPQQQAQAMFPHANLGPGQPATGPAAGQTPGGLPTIHLPGGVSIAPPPLPMTGNAANAPPVPQANGGLIGTAGNVLQTVGNTVRNLLGPPAPTAGAPPPASPGTTPVPGSTPGAMPGLGSVPTHVANAAPAPQVASNGLIGTAGNALQTVTNTIRNLPGPPAPTPGAPPPTSSGTTPGLGTVPANVANPVPASQANGGLIGTAGNVLQTVISALRNLPGPPAPAPGAPPTASPGTMPANVANAAAHVVRTVATALPGAPPPIAQAANPVTAQATSAQPPTGPMQSAQAQAPLQAQAMPAQQPATSMQAVAQAPQPQAGQPQAQSTSTLAQQAAPAAVPQQAQPGRTDAALAPPGNPAADRAAIPQQAQVPVQPGVPGAPQGAALLAAVPLATAVMQAPVAQQLAGNPQAQAPGNPVAGTSALDAGGPVRAELTGTGTYTMDGPGLRRRERMKVGARQMGAWMLAMAQGRLHLVRRHNDDTPREVAKAFQWLFWVLAIVAYGCLGLVLVSFLLSFGELPSAPAMRRWTGEFALSGLLAALGAWWLGRQLTRAQRTPPDPIRR